MFAGAADYLPNSTDGFLEILDVPILRRNHLLPIPLVDIAAVIVVEEVIFAHGFHVGANAFADLAVKLLQGHSLPFGGRLHDLGLDAFVEAQPAGKLDGRARAVAVEVIVDAALAVNDQRNLDHHQIEFLAQVLLDVVLDCKERFLRVLATEKRFVISRQIFRDLFIGADARTRQIRLLVFLFCNCCGSCFNHGALFILFVGIRTGATSN